MVAPHFEIEDAALTLQSPLYRCTKFAQKKEYKFSSSDLNFDLQQDWN
jgi:hypothetical protein